MSTFREQASSRVEIIPTKSFSNFDFIETRFPTASLHRILSLVRLSNFSTMVLEDIENTETSKAEDRELEGMGYTVPKSPIVRLSFFKKSFTVASEIDGVSPEDYLGYAILKHVPLPGSDSSRWIIFESIVHAERHDNNYCWVGKEYEVLCLGRKFKIFGALYCQQNGITNMCAHVALRTCIAAAAQDRDDITYAEMNAILAEAKMPCNGDGLLNEQIRMILSKVGLTYTFNAYEQKSRIYTFSAAEFNLQKPEELKAEIVKDGYGIKIEKENPIDWLNDLLSGEALTELIDKKKIQPTQEIVTSHEELLEAPSQEKEYKLRKFNRLILEAAYPKHCPKPSTAIKFPYQKFLYGSIESGFPALLGFRTENSAHIIPVLGHTFNEDAWVPRAERGYFKVSEEIKYVPSEQWVSTYICHDDNFGSNYCLPKHYLTPANEILVIGIKPNQAVFDATDAEIRAIEFVNKIIHQIVKSGGTRNVWLDRLIKAIWIKKGWVVLRPLFLTGQDYAKHLENMEGRDGEKLDAGLLEKVKPFLVGHYWVIEISLPELFPANRRKLGEVVLDASKEGKVSHFLTRLPGELIMWDPDAGTQSKLSTEIKSHVEVFKKTKKAFR